jgi:type IV secretory pathway ATPase VirB11/archaellum biosynthesis ATPase
MKIVKFLPGTDVSKICLLSGEKINLKFEVSSARPLVYEWLKQGIREDVTLSPPEVRGGINLRC